MASKKSHKCPFCKRTYRDRKRLFACIERDIAKRARDSECHARKAGNAPPVNPLKGV